MSPLLNLILFQNCSISCYKQEMFWIQACEKRAAWTLDKTSLLCFTEEWKSYMLKMTWEWAKDEITVFRETFLFLSYRWFGTDLWFGCILSVHTIRGKWSYCVSQVHSNIGLWKPCEIPQWRTTHHSAKHTELPSSNCAGPTSFGRRLLFTHIEGPKKKQCGLQADWKYEA